MKSSFAHLRVSSEYSIFKGLLSVEKLVEKAKSFGMPAIALTDHSNMFGLVKFFKKCEKEGIKPISGSTLNIARSSEDRPYEFLCLAKNIDGHKNLMHGLSKASRNQSKSILYDDFLNISNDIFVITGSENSEIFSLILNDKETSYINTSSYLGIYISLSVEKRPRTAGIIRLWLLKNEDSHTHM